jgi:hypothetical protein
MSIIHAHSPEAAKVLLFCEINAMFRKLDLRKIRDGFLEEEADNLKSPTTRVPFW